MICASDKHIRFFPRVMTRSFAAMLLVSAAGEKEIALLLGNTTVNWGG